MAKVGDRSVSIAGCEPQQTAGLDEDRATLDLRQGPGVEHLQERGQVLNIGTFEQHVGAVPKGGQDAKGRFASLPDQWYRGSRPPRLQVAAPGMDERIVRLGNQELHGGRA